jgi:hypothetical protein
MERDDLPDDFGFSDFLDAVSDLDAPGDEDLPTDEDGCVELVTIRATEVPRVVARLRDVGIDPHLELPTEEELRQGGATGAVFVPPGELVRARRILGIEA